MEGQATKADADGLTTAIAALETKIAALVAAQQGHNARAKQDRRGERDREVEPVRRHTQIDLTKKMAINGGNTADTHALIVKINCKLDCARQKEQYFLELEDEELDEADKHDRLVQKYKSIRDLNRASRERVLRQRHRMEAKYYADKADHYTAKIQKLKTRRSAVHERAEEEHRGQFEVLLQNNKDCAQEKRRGKSLHRVEPIEGKGSASNGGALVADSVSEETILESGLVASKISAWRGVGFHFKSSEDQTRVESYAPIISKDDIIDVMLDSSERGNSLISAIDNQNERHPKHEIVSPSSIQSAEISFEHLNDPSFKLSSNKAIEVPDIDLIEDDDNEETEFDVEIVLKKQDTHNLFCPNCHSCITKKVILRKRKRSVRTVEEDAKRNKFCLHQIVLKERVYSKYLFKWEGIFQTSEMNSGTSSFEEWLTDAGDESEVEYRVEDQAAASPPSSERLKLFHRGRSFCRRGGRPIKAHAPASSCVDKG